MANFFSEKFITYLVVEFDSTNTKVRQILSRFFNNSDAVDDVQLHKSDELILIKNYSDASHVLFGKKTMDLKKQLLELHCKYNPQLTFKRTGTTRQCGYLIIADNLDKIMDLLEKNNHNVTVLTRQQFEMDGLNPPKENGDSKKESPKKKLTKKDFDSDSDDKKDEDEKKSTKNEESDNESEEQEIIPKKKGKAKSKDSDSEEEPLIKKKSKEPPKKVVKSNDTDDDDSDDDNDDDNDDEDEPPKKKKSPKKKVPLKNAPPKKTPAKKVAKK